MTELTREERNRFIVWLNDEVQQERQLLVQAEKLPHMEALVRYKRNEIGAYLVVMKRLLSMEEMDIGKQDVGEIEKEQGR